MDKKVSITYNPMVNEYIKNKLLEAERNSIYYIKLGTVRLSVAWLFIPAYFIFLNAILLPLLTLDSDALSGGLIFYGLPLALITIYLFFVSELYKDVKKIYSLPLSNSDLQDLLNFNLSREIIDGISAYKQNLDRVDLVYVAYILDTKLKECENNLVTLKEDYNKLKNSDSRVVLKTMIGNQQHRIDNIYTQLNKIDSLLPANRNVKQSDFIKQLNESNQAKLLSEKQDNSDNEL
ncbi:hypothetical protein A7M79_00350 [Acinetobacter baumannii]|uniref:hypothetical protein n=1 Tax=Acinetobacter baumannii TaxID=470 RepID=UPI0008DE4C0A|nr:hypothetical protein [Acinetobacter baumannii]OIH11974.1 hypothetical protein A7M79_00350 [Acinetobacter baumannii]